MHTQTDLFLSLGGHLFPEMYLNHNHNHYMPDPNPTLNLQATTKKQSIQWVTLRESASYLETMGGKSP